MPDTKTCLEDGTQNPADATTCSACGGGSFPDVVGTNAPAAPPPADDEVPTSQELAQRWDTGERPANMCKDCPARGQPCVPCWVRAGYPEAAYPFAEPPVDQPHRADQDAIPTEPEPHTLVGLGDAPTEPALDLPSGPLTHDGDDPGPSAETTALSTPAAKKSSGRKGGGK